MKIDYTNITIKLIFFDIFFVSAAISQKILDLNVLPESLEFLATIIFIAYQVVVFGMYIISNIDEKRKYNEYSRTISKFIDSIGAHNDEHY